MHRPKAFDHVSRQLLGRIGICEIGREHIAGAAAGLDITQRLTRTVGGGVVVHGHAYPRSAERQGQRPTDAMTGSRHQRRLAT